MTAQTKGGGKANSEPPLLGHLREIDPYVFEHFIADVWQHLGYRTDVTDASNDMGVDVIAHGQRPDGTREKLVIQAKRYSASNTVGSPDVQQYASLRMQENADRVVIVSTGYFSSQAWDVADRLAVELVNGRDLCEIVDTLERSDELLDHYLGTQPRATAQTWSFISARRSRSTAQRLLVACVGIYGTVSMLTVLANASYVTLPPGLDNYLLYKLLDIPDAVPGSITLLVSGLTLSILLLRDPTIRWKLTGLCIGCLLLGPTFISVPPYITTLSKVVYLITPALVGAVYAFNLHRHSYALGKRLL